MLADRGDVPKVDAQRIVALSRAVNSGRMSRTSSGASHHRGRWLGAGCLRRGRWSGRPQRGAWWAGRAPVPVGHRHARWRLCPGLAVGQRDPRPPLKIGDERRAELGIGWQARLVGGLAHQPHPAGALLLGQRPTQVARHMCG